MISDKLDQDTNLWAVHGIDTENGDELEEEMLMGNN